MADAADDPTAKNAGPDEIAFDYLKNSDFRSLLVDGAIGALTPAGGLHLALYTERPPIPQRQIFRWDKDTGAVGSLVREIDRGAIVREMSCDVFLKKDTAVELALMILRLVRQLDDQEEENQAGKK